MHRFVLGMFPYPSGRPHLGHVRVYTITDTAARHARLHGHAVLHPIGWDAFGLPAENAALKHGVSAEEWTARNVAYMRSVFRAMGWSFDEDREVDTSSPHYYRWTQWLFLRMWERGLAVRAEGWVHFCPRCATALADEQAQDGACWRCGGPVERRRIPQWTLRISAYADRLWDGLDRLTGWDPRAVAVQRHWIGRTPGTRATVRTARGPIELFVPADAIGPASAVFVAPEHPIAWDAPGAEVRAAARAGVLRSAVERQSRPAENVVPTGVTTEDGLPVWVVDAVVPRWGVEARPYAGGDPALDARVGLRAVEIRGEPAVAWHLRDWSVGRQRRWGCPIPLVECPACGMVPADVLPVRVDAPVDRPCPRCGCPARRQTETLDTFVDSAWYAFRFADARYDEGPFRREEVERWMPIALYVGGLDHAAQHMLYFRFVTKVLADLGLIPFDEPVARFVCNGMVLNAEGRRMSKSAGTGVDPAEVLREHSADALKLAILADTPVERDRPFDPETVDAKARFLERWAARVDAFLATCAGAPGSVDDWPDAPTVARVRDRIAAIDRDVETLALHNAVARLHELAAAIDPVLGDPAPSPAAARAIVRDALIAASVLVPGWVEARWPRAWGARDRWPVADIAPPAEIVVQVDGRTVGRIPASASDDAERDPRVVRRLGGRAVVRVVRIPGRIVNLVTR